MKFILLTLALLLPVSAVDTIMGWRLPLEELTGDLYPKYRFPDHRVPLLDTPPEPSAYFAEASKAKKASTGRPVRPKGCFRALPHKAKSLQQIPVDKGKAPSDCRTHRQRTLAGGR